MPRRMDLRMMRDMARNRRMSRDGRNPYGSRGGYVVRTKPRRDRASEMPREEYYDRNRGMYDYGIRNSEYHTGYDSDYGTGEYNTRDSVYNRELYGYYGDTPFEIKRSYPMQDREMNYSGRGKSRNREMDYARDYPQSGRDYGYDYRMDYGEETKLSKDELEEWCEELTEELDNREKEMLKKDKIMKRAEEMGIKFDHFKPEEYYTTVLMLYTDYKKTLGAASIDIYLKLAKDWLMDDDVEMKHGEKLAAYYDNVVMPE